jgi:MFS family permease
MFFAACINLNHGFEYYMSFSLPIFPAAVVASGIFFFPMSPRFALLKFKRKQQPDEGVQRAKASLKRLRGNEIEADKELFELQQAMDSEVEEAPFWTLFSDMSIFKRLLICIFLQVGQQFTGINAILSYGPSIFIDAGVEFTGDKTQDGLIATALCNFCLLCSVIAAMFVIDVWGRRFLLLLGGGIMTVSMTVAAVLARLIHDMEGDASMEETKKTYAYALVVAVCFYMLGFGPWGAIPWAYPSEIFPMDVKEKAMSVSTVTQWTMNAIIAMWCVHQVSNWGSWGTLTFYAICCGVVVVIASLIVPEIKGVRTEDMESIFGARKTSPQEERLAEA